MWFRGRVSVKLLKTGRIRIDYLDHSQQIRRKLRDLQRRMVTERDQAILGRQAAEDRQS